MIDRPVADVVADWLRDEGSDEVAVVPGAAPVLARARVTRQERYVAQRLFGDDIGRAPLVRWALVVVGLVLVIAGITTAGAGLLDVERRQPVEVPPNPVVPEATILPGHRLLVAIDHAVSIQLPLEWTNQPELLSGQELIQARIGSAGLIVARGAADGTSFDEFVTRHSQAQAAVDAWGSFARTDGMHGTHRAVRISPMRNDAPIEQVVYIVEGPGGTPFVVSLAWDPGHHPQEFGFDVDKILGSFNPDGPGPAWVEPVR